MKRVAGHRVSICEKLAMALFKMSNSCARRRLAARNWRSSAAVTGSRAVPSAAATAAWTAFYHWQRRLGSMLSARAAAWVERLYSASRKAPARKAASYLRRLSGFVGSFMTKERYHPNLSRFTKPSYCNHDRRHSSIGYQKLYQFHQQQLNNIT